MMLFGVEVRNCFGLMSKSNLKMLLHACLFFFSDYQTALDFYTEAIEACPPSDNDDHLAICFANRAACNSKQVCYREN